MASPQPGRLFLTPSPASMAPSRTPLSDDALWRRLREAGFDEDSIKRRDKAALIAYIAKLEAEVFDHQHEMGILLMERKDWESKYEQMKATAESTDMMYRREKAAHLSGLNEARKREDSLKKALGVEKECVANIEKALHEMRAESAETKVAAEIKLTDARNLVEEAQNKFSEAEAKLRAAESLQAEGSRYHRTAERKMQELEAREDDLRRRIIAFKSDCDAKEKELSLERQSVSDRQKILQEGQQRLLDEQASMNQREEYIFSRYQELDRLGKELEASKANLEKESAALIEEKSNIELKIVSLAAKEEAVFEKEAFLNKKELELATTLEKRASKESNDIKKILADEEARLKLKQSEFEEELQKKAKMVEDEIENKRRVWELKEVDLTQKEDSILEKEHELEIQSRALIDREKDVMEKFSILEEKEKNLVTAEKEFELQKNYVQKEKEEINRLRQDLKENLDLLEDKRKQLDSAGENLEMMKNETHELMLLELKLKEEIDVVRAQKDEVLSEAEKLKSEKAKFELEWELIDEKREELRRESEHIDMERETILNSLKEERNFLKLEREAMRDQHKRDTESFLTEREAFTSEMERERSEWFSKIQQERADLLLDLEMQRKELQNSFDKRREEIESSLKDIIRACDQERKNERDKIMSDKETVAKDQEHISFEWKRLEAERIEISHDRELREKEWSELSSLIDELKMQQKKLEEQRELLHSDREKIHAQIGYLEKLENLKMIADNIAEAEIEKSKLVISRRRPLGKRLVKLQAVMQAPPESHKDIDAPNDHIMHVPSQHGASPSAAPLTWLKRCADLIFKQSSEKVPLSNGLKSLVSDHEDTYYPNAGHLSSASGPREQLFEESEVQGGALCNKPVRDVGEAKVLVEAPFVCEGLTEQEFSGGKRTIDLLFGDGVDPPLEQKQFIKKRKQQDDAARDIFEDAAEQGGTQPKVSHDHTAGSVDQSQVHVTAETNVLVEKVTVTSITEVNYKNADIDESMNQTNVQHFQKSVTQLE